jgi:hypothetical protein
MKILKLIVTAMCVSVLALFLFAAECGVPVESADIFDSLPTYFIIFKLDGESKTFDKGMTLYERQAFGNEHPLDGKTTLFAMPNVETGEVEPITYIWIDFNGTDEDTYPAIFLNADISYFQLRIDGGANVSNSNVTVQVTSYGVLGETIEGYFSGLLTDGSIITEGVFKVFRAPDNTFPPIAPD